MDTTDTETCGRTKREVSYNHTRQRVGHTHLATCAQAGVPLAVDLRNGTSDPRTYSVQLMERALIGLARIGVYRPADPTAPRPRFRADSGYMASRLAHTATEAGCDFAFGVRRGPTIWDAVHAVPAGDWQPSVGMAGATPRAWCVGSAWTPPPSRLIRGRGDGTIDPDQLALTLNGEADHVYAYSFIATNLP